MTDTLLISIRFLLFADLMLIVGLAAFPIYAMRGSDRDGARIAVDLAAVQPWLCAVGLLVSGAGMIVLTARMHGVAIGDLDPGMVFSLAVETDVGKGGIVRLLALALALAAALQRDRHPFAAAACLSVTGAVALASLVWSGHAAAAEGWAGTVHRLSDALHMIAAGVWIGAIAAFLILLRPAHDDLRPARLTLAVRGLDQFARVGTICVIVIAATGMINLEMIVGIAQAGSMPGAAYGNLLVAKLILFGLMLGLAALNRWRLVPAFAEATDDTPTAAIRRSLMCEGSAAVIILALVAWLGMLEP